MLYWFGVRDYFFILDFFPPIAVTNLIVGLKFAKLIACIFIAAHGQLRNSSVRSLHSPGRHILGFLLA